MYKDEKNLKNRVTKWLVKTDIDDESQTRDTGN